jgi:hypothetical protein
MNILDATNTGGQHERLSRVYNNGTDIVRMGFELGNLLRGVVVVYAQLVVVRT